MEESIIAQAEKKSTPDVARHLTLVAWVVALAVNFLLPSVYFIAGFRSESSTLESSVRLLSRLGSHDVQQRVNGLSAEESRRILAALVAESGLGSVRVVNAVGEVVLVHGDRHDFAVATGTHLKAPNGEEWYLEASQPLFSLVARTIAVGILGVLLGWLVFVWLRALSMRAINLALQEIEARKAVQERLEQTLSIFSATFESTADGIFVADVSGRAVVCNERFLELWNLPKTARFGHMDVNEPLAALAAQLRDPGRFFVKQRGFAHRPDSESCDILELKDGRTFEWRSMPQRVDGKPVGRVSSFRDISERRRAEVLLTAEKEVLELVVNGAPLREALSVLARYVENQSRHMFCSILFRENDGDQALSCATGPSLPEQAGREVACQLPAGLLEAVQLTEGLAAHEIGTSVAWADYRRLMKKWSIEACFSVPIRSSLQELLGFVVAHYRSPQQRESHDIELIQVATKLTSIAIERRRAEVRLHQLAHFDALTGLPNRLLFRDRLNRAIARADRADAMVAVMFLDLDRFKTINDTLGHDAGDQLLREVSARLRHCVREEDTVARLGGDEFTVILEKIGRAEDSAPVARKIIEALAPSVMLAGQETFVTTSIGIAIYPTDADNLEDLLKNADTAMYQAKESGRNRFRFYTAEMNVMTSGRLKIESGLRRALERNELEVHYQPKVSLKQGTIIGAEALLRWNPPDQMQVSPAEFIPILEETGLIEPVGEWVLRTVCRQNRLWQESGLPPLRIAVNLSGCQLQRNNLAETLAQILEETGLDPALLDLEVTESMLMKDPDYAAGILQQVRAKGIMSIDIDDFGTGYSSLSYLKRFPIDALKIDKSFICNLPDDEEDVAIALAIIALAHSLNLKVVAEGVETQQQLNFLRQHQCDEVQGYLVSKPLPAAEFERLLRGDTGSIWSLRTRSLQRKSRELPTHLPPLSPVASLPAATRQ